MALLPCPECKKDVSDKATACPHCGLPMHAPAPAVSVGVGGAPAGASHRRRTGERIAGVVLLALVVGGGVALAMRRPDYSRVEQLRAEQDSEGTHDEHVRQRFFRLYKDHPKNAMYIYLWSRCVDDPAKQLELAEEGMQADPDFSWNYNMAARALARLNRIPDAYDRAVKGSAIDPGNLELADKQRSLKVIIDRKLAEQASPAPNDKGGARYQGLFRAVARSPEPADVQAIERSRLPDYKGPLAEEVRGIVVCANPYADACVRAYVPRDARFKAAWAPPAVDVGAIKEHQLVTVVGTVVTDDKGENIVVADAVTVEPQ
jgi:hypothetical protein